MGHIVVSRQSAVGSRQLPSVECCKEEAAEVLTTEDYGLAAEKVGGTGRWARSREMKKKGGKMGDYSESAGVNDSSGQQSRGLRAFFGRLAVRRPATLPLWPSIDRVNVAAVRCVTRLLPFED